MHAGFPRRTSATRPGAKNLGCRGVKSGVVQNAEPRDGFTRTQPRSILYRPAAHNGQPLTTDTLPGLTLPGLALRAPANETIELERVSRWAAQIAKSTTTTIAIILKEGYQNMPTIKIEGEGEFQVEAGKRLVLALKEDAATDQLHACGGNARCTTCRVEVLEGEPEKMTLAERDCLQQRGLAGVRLSCQMLCEGDMSLRLISRLEGSGRADAGSAVAAELTPEPVWVDKA